MILLDTHVLVWQEQGDRRLGRQARQAVARALAAGQAAVSAITFWEVGMRIQQGQLALGFDLDAWRHDLLDQGVIEIPVDGRVATRAGTAAGHARRPGRPAHRRYRFAGPPAHHRRRTHPGLAGHPGLACALPSKGGPPKQAGAGYKPALPDPSDRDCNLMAYGAGCKPALPDSGN